MLLVKAVALYLIWAAWFSNPESERIGHTGAAGVLMTTPPASGPSPGKDNRHVPGHGAR